MEVQLKGLVRGFGFIIPLIGSMPPTRLGLFSTSSAGCRVLTESHLLLPKLVFTVLDKQGMPHIIRIIGRLFEMVDGRRMIVEGYLMR